MWKKFELIEGIYQAEEKIGKTTFTVWIGTINGYRDIFCSFLMRDRQTIILGP